MYGLIDRKLPRVDFKKSDICNRSYIPIAEQIVHVIELDSSLSSNMWLFKFK